MSAIALATTLLRQFEGFRAAPYQDSAGIWTIGYGTIRIDSHRVTAATPPVTEEQAEALLQAELQPTADAVDAAVLVDLTDAQRAALYSFAYNEGIFAFRSSTLLRRLNAGDYAGAAQQFDRWVYAGGHVVRGLVNRRAAERALFEGTAEPPST